MKTKADLLSEIESSWRALQTALGHLSDAQLTIPRDAQGWTAKDHVIHLAAWEQSAVFFLQGKPRHEGLGVEEAVYERGSDDEINAVIYQQRKDWPLGEALARLDSTHRQLMALLEPLSDDDLNRPYRRYLPDEPGEGAGPPAMNVIHGNSAYHFAEHLPWIEVLAGKGE